MSSLSQKHKIGVQRWMQSPENVPDVYINSETGQTFQRSQDL